VVHLALTIKVPLQGCSYISFHAQYPRSANHRRRYGDPGGPLAMIDSELRQARKGATVIIESCAGVWLSGSPPYILFLLYKTIFYALACLKTCSATYINEIPKFSRMSDQHDIITKHLKQATDRAYWLAVRIDSPQSWPNSLTVYSWPMDYSDDI
jgi:hypothetical protein